MDEREPTAASDADASTPTLLLGPKMAPAAPTEAWAAMHRLRARVLGRSAPAVRIGRYVLGTPLGAGGMAVVFEGHDPDLDRTVAIKVLRTRCGPRREASIREECRALARLEHPNVVQVFDVGRYESAELSELCDGALPARGVYMVMERLRGQPLGRWLESERSVGEILCVFERAGLALASAHEVGLVHRDFKPSNVFMADTGQPKVLDFGIAIALETRTESPLSDASSREVDGAGTPGYMPPEQYGGGPVDPRADQYAFCVSLYQALYGTRPFIAKDRGALFDEAHRGLGRLPARAEVPRRVTLALRRGLAASPGERFASMNDLLSQLRPPRRGPLWLGLAGLGAVAITLVGAPDTEEALGCEPLAREARSGWTPARRNAIRRAMERTEAPFAAQTAETMVEAIDRYAQRWWATHQDVCGSDPRPGPELQRQLVCLHGRVRTLDALVDSLQQIDPERMGTAVDHASRLPDVQACTRTTPGSTSSPPPPAELTASLERAAGLFAAGRDEEARRTFENVARRASVGGFSELRASSGFEAGRAARALGDLDDAERWFLEVVWGASGSDSMELRARSYTALADLARERGDYEMARSHLQHARVAAEPLETRDDLDYARFDARGALALEEGRLDDAERAFERMAEASRDELDRIPALNNLAGVAFMRGDYDEARPRYERAREATAALFGDDHPRTGRVEGNLGNVRVRLGEFEAGLAAGSRALDIARDTGDPQEYAAALGNYAGLLVETGNHAEAVDAIEAFDQRHRGAELNPVRDSVLRLNLQFARIGLQRWEAVEAGMPDLSQAIARVDERHPTRTLALAVRAELALHRGELDQAQALAERALTLLGQSTTDPALVGDACDLMDRVLVARGRPGAEYLPWRVAAVSFYEAAGPLGARRLDNRPRGIERISATNDSAPR